MVEGSKEKNKNKKFLGNWDNFVLQNFFKINLLASMSIKKCIMWQKADCANPQTIQAMTSSLAS